MRDSVWTLRILAFWACKLVHITEKTMPSRRPARISSWTDKGSIERPSRMDPSQLPSMRSGFGSTENSNAERAGNDFVRTSMGLLRVFSEEAVKTAGEYAIANDRTSVSHEDMQKGLKYQARMFFQTVENFDGRVDEAARELLAGDDNEEESGEEGEEGEEDEEGEEEEEEEGEQEDEEGEEGEEQEGI